MKPILHYLSKNWKAILLLVIGVLVAYMLASYAVVRRENSRVFTIEDPELISVASDIQVGIVFGGGISDEGPRPLLENRLNTAKQLLDEGFVDKLILSGDNRYLDYNEPAAMFMYLTERGVDPDRLQADFAGRSTYETCERAKKVFGVHEALLISESTHLARAIYLCRHFGIDAYGVQSDGQASSGLKIGQRWREVLASSKAVFNAYIIGEETVLGTPINL